jgi:hypothetical protein
VKRVLVLDADPMLTTAVARCLHEEGVEVLEQSCTSTIDEWAPGPFDLALIDARFTSSADRIGAGRVVVMVSYPDPEAEREVAARFISIRKPFTSAQLLSLLDDELGWVRYRPGKLVDALRAAHSELRSLRIVLDRGESTAEIHMVNGEVHDATFGDLCGEDALCALLRSRRSVREVATVAPSRRTVTRPFRELLFDLLTRIDEDEGVTANDGAPS